MRNLLVNLMLVLASAVAVQGQAPQTRPADISLASTVEEGRKMILATVTLRGQPLEGVRVGVFVPRLFGDLKLGEDQTLDDGTAAVPFPADLPAGPDGQIEVIARVLAPERHAATSARQLFPGGRAVNTAEEPLPRALWAPRAPPALLLSVALLLLGAWSTYAYVILQLRKIWKEATP